MQVMEIFQNFDCVYDDVLLTLRGPANRPQHNFHTYLSTSWIQKLKSKEIGRRDFYKSKKEKDFKLLNLNLFKNQSINTFSEKI